MEASVASQIRRAMVEKSRVLRQQCIPISDSFGFPDFVLKSPFGRYDGNVYESFFQRVMVAPKSTSLPSYWRDVFGAFTMPDDS